jgi:recombination protein RecR
MAIENSGRFKGQFHILGGVLNPLAGTGPDQLRIQPLLERVKEFDHCSLILAINPSVEGDATCSYLKQLMPDNVKLERIGFGVPIGGSLEYLDPMTISKALENKQVL